MHLKIITPKKIVLEKDINQITVPSSSGEITILPHHTHLFTLLQEGIIKYFAGEEEEFLAIGGGYLETDGKLVELLVTRAYGQDAVDQKQTQDAVEKARQDMKAPKDKQHLEETSALLRKSLVDLKLIKKKAPKSFGKE